MSTRLYSSQVVAPLVLICLILFLLVLAQRLSSLSVWDDAYMFVRYADNLIDYGNLAWNPSSESTFGLTSLAYLFVVIPFRVIFPTEPALVMLLASMFCGFLSLLLIIRVILKLIANNIHRLIVLVIVSLSSLVASDSMTTHLTSGMDTMFTVLLLTVWIGILYLSDNYVVMGVVGGLFFVIRPDLLIFCVGLVPAILISASYSQSIKFVVALLIVLILQLLFAGWYFGHPLPLPFYAKNTFIYGEAFYAYYTNTSWHYLLDFLRSYPYLLIILFAGIVTHRRCLQWQDRGLIFGGILFCVYHVVLVVPIMGFSHRFLFPLVPILLILTGRLVPYLVLLVPQSISTTIQNYPIRILFVPLLLLLALINPMPLILTFIQYSQPDKPPTVGMGQFDLQTSYQLRYHENWYRLDELSKLDNDIVIATTEIGLPGVMNPQKHIIDLAGLNQANFALDGFSADWLLLEGNQPDWIYMPFPHYEVMWYTIAEHPTFQSNYQLYPARLLGTTMDVAIRYTSPFYSDMLEILKDL